VVWVEKRGGGGGGVEVLRRVCGGGGVEVLRRVSGGGGFEVLRLCLGEGGLRFCSTHSKCWHCVDVREQLQVPAALSCSKYTSQQVRPRCLLRNCRQEDTYTCRKSNLHSPTVLPVF